MGFYVEQKSKGEGLLIHDKADQLIADGATRVDGRTFVPRMICVVDNGNFDAAAWAYNKKEHSRFQLEDGRTKQWLQVSIQVMKTNFSQETLDEYPEGVQ